MAFYVFVTTSIAAICRGIEREIESLEQKLRRIDAGRRQNVPCLIARPGPARSEP
jgi:hypothetical protein